MIVYDKEQKEIVIPNGIGNINLFNNGVEAGYNQGKIDGIEEQKAKLESISITENGTYNKEDGYNHIEVNVPDLNGSYDEGYEQGHTEGYNEGYTEGEGVGYNQGKTDGINEQKGKLSQITISENGTYAKEDGYNKVIVNVPDLNGDYNEGYEQGQADLAAKARVLNVTENGQYMTKFSDPIVPEIVTGVYADGTNFYSYAELNAKVFNTKIAATIDSRLEFWYKGDNTSVGFGDNVIIGAGNNDDNNCFQVRYYEGFNSWVKISVGNSLIDINNWDDKVWHHLIISKAEGLWVDGEKKGDFTASNTINGKFYINGIRYDTAKNANGTFGMVKIDDVVIIPTADGFQNVNTGELLQVVKDGTYTFTENLPIYGEGELYKTINVNVPDLNGSYDEGYEQGKTEGEQEGYKQGQADIVAKARVLNVTENGVYKSKYSDPIVPDTYTVTGVYADGTNFYNYAELNGKVFNTKIAGSVDSRLEFWYKGDNTSAGSGLNVIMGSGDYANNAFEIKYHITENNILLMDIGTSPISVSNWDDTVWHHLIISKAEGIWIDGEKKGDFSPTTAIKGELLINGVSYDTDGTRNANGCFGMIKIDNTTIIPTADGFLNTNTGELLEVVKDGGYNFTENLPTYPEGEGELYKTINVNIDVDSYYNNGYNQGKTDGANEQKGKLESINITENGTYTKEDGYNEIVVDVPDLNGSYDEGYSQGQADVAANARVLNVTKNGTYLSKFSESIIPTDVTGVYANGTNFYSYAELNGKVFNTNIPATKDSRIEFWWKNDATYTRYAAIIGGQTDEGYIFKFAEYSRNMYRIEYGNHISGILFTYEFGYDMTSRWNHIIFSKQDGLYVNDELICEAQGEEWAENETIPNFWINAAYLEEASNNANGTFGMIKINDTIIIPTADGFQNVNTGELLEVVHNGTYTFTENLPTYGEGELYKTINVNVVPKINVKEAGLKFGYSNFEEVPEWADFEGITDMSSMFSWCGKLQTIPLIDTSNVTNMRDIFYYCSNLQTIPLINTSNVTNMNSMLSSCSSLQTIPQLDTSKVTDMGGMFANCNNLQTISQLDTSNVTNMTSMFAGCSSLVSIPALNARSLNMPSYGGFFGYSDLPKLTDFGGLLNLKSSLTSNYNFKQLPNLTYESCINVLNGLYDFTGNGETPGSNQGQLKVAQSFIDKVGDEISIGVAKGWTITA